RAVDRVEGLACPGAGAVQGFDEDLLAGAGFALHQDRDVLFQQPLRLADDLVHARITSAQGMQVWLLRRALGSLGAEVARLDRSGSGRATYSSVKAKMATGAQAEGLTVRL